MFDLRQMIQNRSRWFWIRSIGVLLAVAPSAVFLTVLLMETYGEESAPMAPFVEYLVVAMVALLLGYGLTHKGAEEEERERIRTLIREILAEERRFSVPPLSENPKVTPLPFMENE